MHILWQPWPTPRGSQSKNGPSDLSCTGPRWSARALIDQSLAIGFPGKSKILSESVLYSWGNLERGWKLKVLRWRHSSQLGRSFHWCDLGVLLLMRSLPSFVLLFLSKWYTGFFFFSRLLSLYLWIPTVCRVPNVICCFLFGWFCIYSACGSLTLDPLVFLLNR